MWTMENEDHFFQFEFRPDQEMISFLNTDLSPHYRAYSKRSNYMYLLRNTVSYNYVHW